MQQAGIGKTLRKTREDLGLTISDVAAQTRIAARFLEALEDNRHEELPGLVFTRNFVRQYAAALKLDPEPLLAAIPRLDESHIQLPVPPSKARSARWDSREKSMAYSAIWLALIAGGGWAAWRFWPAEPVTAFRKLIPATVFQVGRAVPALPAVQASSRAPQPVPADAPKALPEQSEATPAAPVTTQITAQATTPAVTPATSPVMVEVRAIQASWVSLAADGKSSFSGVLKENEVRRISASEQVKMVTGNAGGVTVSLNGRELERLGPEGQVRVLRLTAEGPEFLARTPRPASAPL